MKLPIPAFRFGRLSRIDLPRVQALRAGAIITVAVLLTGGIAEPALATPPSSTFRFALPGGAALLFSNASNPQAPLAERAWQKAAFYFPNGATFSVLPRPGESRAGTEIEPPSASDVSPSGQYMVIRRVESGTVSSGPGQAETMQNREYCSAIEIASGCITADQTGEICGAGWLAGQPAQWGTDDQTNLMLKHDRPSASRVLHFMSAGQPPRLLVDDDSGADNLMRCDPPSAANRDAYRKIVIALRAAGEHHDAQLIDTAILQANSNNSSSTPTGGENRARVATVSVQKATLYTEPDEAHPSRAYLVRNDAVSVLKQLPSGWAYLDYVNASGKHLLRWIKVDQLVISP
ncbi:hypothetical protein [Paraburkholderia kururiensis]|uniref:hypothetical protein n=1 Tax=Paraburkholderia kururiensis TaxID=984307 RepID=UPI001267DE12|nr:hypothetical protein [Paraburkholderia kururiensis]